MSDYHLQLWMYLYVFTPVNRQMQTGEKIPTFSLVLVVQTWIALSTS